MNDAECLVKRQGYSHSFSTRTRTLHALGSIYADSFSLVLFLFNEVVKVVKNNVVDHLPARIGEPTISRGLFVAYGLLARLLFYQAVLSGPSITL